MIVIVAAADCCDAGNRSCVSKLFASVYACDYVYTDSRVNAVVTFSVNSDLREGR